MTTPVHEHPAQPRSLTDLFVSFSLLALQGFGGVLAVVQRELVEKKRWMTRATSSGVAASPCHPG